MFGENLELIALQCVVCKRWTALRLDPEDLEQHLRHGVFVQHAFVDRNGVPYLGASLRELFISKVCPDCWDLLCPDPIAHPTVYN